MITQVSDGTLRVRGAEARRNDERAVTFFKRLTFGARAAQLVAGGARTRDIVCAGDHVRLRFAGPELEHALWPAFAHLAGQAEGEPDLVVDLWDVASTRVASPLPAWATLFGPRGELRLFEGDRHRAAYQHGSGALSFLDLEAGHGVFVVPDPDLPAFERAAPLRALLAWWSERQGRQLVHAAALGTPAGGLLLAGKGGSGKSTTSLTCLLGGMGFAADDFCLVGGGPVPHVFSLFASAKVDAGTLDRLPALAGEVRNADRVGEEKALLLLADRHRDRLCTGFPLRAIVVPHVAGGLRSALGPISRAAALLALAPSTVNLLPGAGEEAMRFLGDLARTVPCYGLALGNDAADLPALLGGLAAGRAG